MEQLITTATSSEPKISRKELRAQLLGPNASRALAFQNVAVRHFGPAAGIFCRQLLFWDGSGWDGEGWIYKSMKDWEEETGLTRRNWERARKVLTGKKVMEEKKATGPDGRQRLFYRLDLAQLMEAVGDDLPNAQPSTSTQDCTVLPSGDDAHYYRAGTMPTNSVQAIQESTQEITQKEEPPHTPPKRGCRVKEKGSPTPVVDALKDHERLSRFAAVAGRWDFTLEEEPPFKVLARLGGTDEERYRNLKSIQSVSRRVVRGSEDREESSEGSSKGELTPDELEAVRHEIVNNPKSAASHHARRFWNGEKRLNQVVIEVLDAVNHRVFGGNRNISTFGEDVEAILRDQKAYLDGLKSNGKKSSQPHRAKKTMV